MRCVIPSTGQLSQGPAKSCGETVRRLVSVSGFLRSALFISLSLLLLSFVTDGPDASLVILGLICKAPFLESPRIAILVTAALLVPRLPLTLSLVSDDLTAWLNFLTIVVLGLRRILSLSLPSFVSDVSEVSLTVPA